MREYVAIEPMSKDFQLRFCFVSLLTSDTRSDVPVNIDASTFWLWVWEDLPSELDDWPNVGFFVVSPPIFFSKSVICVVGIIVVA